MCEEVKEEGGTPSCRGDSLFTSSLLSSSILLKLRRRETPKSRPTTPGFPKKYMFRARGSDV
jgi:hypothetical protein